MMPAFSPAQLIFFNLAPVAAALARRTSPRCVSVFVARPVSADARQDSVDLVSLAVGDFSDLCDRFRRAAGSWGHALL